ncbi:jg8271 [Pararge aegeria aegeria]|uniref:Jg8271 protein n=1 Tax=Pararge aegeria aegeria TaxID=348720 RepID=A0A8S4RHU9_9NEOP|nr:jg8271 [Pararge aegeria aegeria]
MSKTAQSKHTQIADGTSGCKSTFMLTFALEITGIDFSQDYAQGRLKLGPYQQAVKLQYQLYPGQSFDAKNDKTSEVILPPLKFGERRYFGPVLETEETIEQFIENFLWNLVQEHIPSSYLDGLFDTPCNTTDIRHQDTILSKVQENILSKTQVVEDEEFPVEPEESFVKTKVRRESKISKEKERNRIVEENKEKFTIFLSGDTILAGSGRIIAFESIGERPAEQCKIIAQISSHNLPAEDDQPIIFINVETLNDIPIQLLKKTRISQIFTRWKIGEEEHSSIKQNARLFTGVKINDHHTVPLQFSNASEITASFLDNPLEIELYGVRQSKSSYYNPILFGNEKLDCNFGFTLPSNANTRSHEEVVPIAVTKIDASSLAKETNGIIRGEFCLYPVNVSVTDRSREDSCTNDINGIKKSIKPDIIIQPSEILQAQMTLEVSIEMLSSATPFYVLKMSVPINTLLACPQVYVKPSLPLPTRSALLKVGRLIASKFKLAPYKNEMPTYDELNSFRLELCIPPRCNWKPAII